MAHRYPEGEQAKRNEWERRVLQADVDIKRLWKWMPDPLAPLIQFDGNQQSSQPVLIYITGFTTDVAEVGFARFAQAYNDGFGSSGLSAQIVGSTTGLGGVSLNTYRLIHLLHNSYSHDLTAIDLTGANVSDWLAGGRQRRFVFSGPSFLNNSGDPEAPFVTARNAYLASAGTSMVWNNIKPLPTGTTTVVPTSHYLANGTLTVLDDDDGVDGGTAIYQNTTATPDHDVMCVETMASGAEFIIAAFTLFPNNSTVLASNGPFLRGLYPSADYGGNLVP